MPSRRINVFFYGLFMDVDLLRAKGVDPANTRLANVSGFALRIGKRATLVPNDGARCYGVVMELTQSEIDRLYSEAGVAAYRPEAVTVELSDRSRTAALCFNLVEPPGLEERNLDYATNLRELARRLKLPSDYVDSIA
jgi:hypothetical protein